MISTATRALSPSKGPSTRFDPSTGSGQAELSAHAALFTSDGGARQPEADLWCSYAATRTLRWLGEPPADPSTVADFLRSRQNPDGGFAWQRGLPSDVWASYYCAQALRDLDQPVPQLERLADWVARVRTPDGGFAMRPGLAADVWATYYASRLYAEIVCRPVPDLDSLSGWLGRLQIDGGGLAWSPGNPHADARACYYAAVAWQAASRAAGSDQRGGDAPLPWRRAGLVTWLQDRQHPEGGYSFTPDAAPCAWATFRAVGALRALDASPRDVDGVLGWLAARRLDGGGFERWPGYRRADVWACFCVVGTLLALDQPLDLIRACDVEFLTGCQLPGSGFTYREPEAAGDSLATAAALLTEPAGSVAIAPLAKWLRRAQTPYEGGVMYMPGRGAEIRCTLWAASALRRAQGTVAGTLDRPRLAAWLSAVQNVDGGVGYWMGRGSDLVSTSAAVDTAVVAGLDPSAVLNGPALLRFLESCRADGSDLRTGGYCDIPGGTVTLAATAQAARVATALGRPAEGAALALSLSRWASPLGGYSAVPRGVPDLASTYQAVLTCQLHHLPWDTAMVDRLLRRLEVDGGYAWSPLSRHPGGPLATCLGRLLSGLVAGDHRPLPRLSL